MPDTNVTGLVKMRGKGKRKRNTVSSTFKSSCVQKRNLLLTQQKSTQQKISELEKTLTTFQTTSVEGSLETGLYLVATPRATPGKSNYAKGRRIHSSNFDLLFSQEIYARSRSAAPTLSKAPNKRSSVSFQWVLWAKMAFMVFLFFKGPCFSLKYCDEL